MSYVEYVTDDPVDDDAQELARANGFSKDDLEQNRQGKISKTQHTRLYARALGPLRYSLGALIGWLIFCFIVRTLVPGIVLTITALIGGKSLTAVFAVVTLSCAGAVVASLIQSGRRTVLLFQDLSAGRAAWLDGRVSPSREDRQGLGMARLWGEKHTNAWYVIQDT